MERPCPTCGKPAEWENNPDRPFCSDRCRLLDLGAWADERYVVETDGAEDDGASTSIVDGSAQNPER
jgi:endogenous inhibitor of DNA gyrase (YacG/DUF329 family)